MSPDFTIAGNPGGVRTKATALRQRATTFADVATGLTSITTGGWTGRAADRFRERFDVEPTRWQHTATGFLGAANALDAYADALAQAQGRAATAKAEYERGDRETAAARSAYDRSVTAARHEKATWEAENGPGTYTLTIEPFHDPGAAIRAAAVAEVESARAALDNAAHVCAAAVKAACEFAPASRNWFESGLAFIGGVFYGAGEAVWQLGDLLVHLQFGPVFDLVSLASGDLTIEELAAKNQLKAEQVSAIWNAFTTDPMGFGKQVGKAVLDWDTWSDDPARALGHLVPDIAIAVLTGGTATAATRGGRAVQRTLMVLEQLTGADLAKAGLRGLSRLVEHGLTDFRSLDRAAVGLERVASWTGEEGRFLTASQNAAADSFLRGAAIAEPRITDDITDVARAVGADQPGLDFRLKGEDSFKRKFADEIALGQTPDGALASVSDSVRYTMTASGDDYAQMVADARRSLADKGYVEVKWKDSWGSDGYQGINSQWETPDGAGRIEVQFHTPESFAAKMETHELYEAQRLLPPDSAEAIALAEQQREIFSQVPQPGDLDRVAAAHLQDAKDYLHTFLKAAAVGGGVTHAGVTATRLDQYTGN